MWQSHQVTKLSSQLRRRTCEPDVDEEEEAEEVRIGGVEARASRASLPCAEGRGVAVVERVRRASVRIKVWGRRVVSCIFFGRGGGFWAVVSFGVVVVMLGLRGTGWNFLENWKVIFGDANGGADLYTKGTLVGPVEELFKEGGEEDNVL